MSDSYHSHGHSPAFIKSGYEFMQKIGQTLELPQLTIATGVIYYHRFFTSKNNSKIHPSTNMVYPPNKMDAQMLEEEKSGIYSLAGLIAVASIFLATKVEETPKKLKDVIIIAHRAKGITLEITSSKYTTYRTEVLNCEKNILQSMAFELTMEHPYKFLLDYIKKVCGNTVDQDTTKSLAQTAWNFVNDSLKTLVCLEYRPQVIAVAAIHMAATFHKVNISEVENKPWYLSFNDPNKENEKKIDEKSIEEIRIKLMALYQPQAEPTRGNVMDMNAYKQMKNVEKSPSTPQSPRTPSHSTPTTAYADTYPPQPTYFSEQKAKTEQETTLQDNNHPPLPRPPSEPPKPQVPPSPLSRQPPPPNQPDKPPPPIKPEFSAILKSITSPSRGESPRKDRLSRDSSPRRQSDRSRPYLDDDEADMRQKLSNSKDRDVYKERRIDDRSRSHEGSHERSRDKDKNEYDRNDRRDNYKKNDRERDRRNDDRDRDRRNDDRDRDRDRSYDREENKSRPYEKREEKDEFKDEPKKSHETRDRSYDREENKSRPYEKRDERENRNHNDRDRNHNDRDRNHNDRDDNRGSDRRTENRDKNRDWEDKKNQDRRDSERRNDREHDRNHDRDERDYHDSFDETRRSNASYPSSNKPPPRRQPPQKRTSPLQDDRSSDNKRPRHS